MIDGLNSTQYGFAAYIFLVDLKKIYVAQRLNSGNLGINETSTASDLTGRFNEPGFGMEGGKAGIMEYFKNKIMVF